MLSIDVFNAKRDYYERIAVTTVIGYFKEQGIRLNLSDFNLNKYAFSTKKWETNVSSFLSDDGTTLVTVMFDGALKKYVLPKKDNFLNYIHCRVQKSSIDFSFSWKDLDFIALKDSSVEADTDAEKLEKVKRKIEKLMALADVERNPSEQEAISASLKVQKLLSEYHLTFAQVMGGTEAREDVEQVVADCGKGSSQHNWRFNLANYVANGYCCKYFRMGADKKDCVVIFFGYKEDVLLARRVYTYLYNVGNKLGNQFARNNSHEFNAYTSFCLGFASGVGEQLKKQCTALALVIQPEVEKSWETFSADFKTAQSRACKVSGRAYEEGQIEGRMAMNANYLEN